jgi:hypothetical protein
MVCRQGGLGNDLNVTKLFVGRAFLGALEVQGENEVLSSRPCPVR